MSDQGDQVDNDLFEDAHAVLSPRALEDIVRAAVSAAVGVVAGRPEGAKTGEISNLLSDFEGKPSDDVTAWFKRIDTIQGAYNFSDATMLMVAAGKLKGYAEDWFNSKPEYAALSLQELKFEMLLMFNIKENLVALMKRFDNRKWRRNETFSAYFQDKVLLGNKLNLSEPELISYIIEGFDNPVLQSQAKMKQFQSLNQLLCVMNEVSDGERMGVARRFNQTVKS